MAETGWGDAREIHVLTLTEAVRKRPSMYFKLDDPLLASKLVAESLCWATEARWASIQLGHGNVSMGFGQALPTSPRPCGTPAATFWVTEIAAPGPPRLFEDDLLCGGGLPIINAASSDFRLWVDAEGQRWDQRFIKGRAVTPFEVIPGRVSYRDSTMIDFSLDPEIIPDVRFDYNWLCEWGSALPLDLKIEVIGSAEQEGYRVL